MERTKLQEVLHERGITQRELMRMVNEIYPERPISLATLNRCITGLCDNIQTYTILRISSALDLTPNDIMEH